MNINKTEGALWHFRRKKTAEPQSADADHFTRLMGMNASLAETVSEQTAVFRHPKQRYRLVEGPAAGLICETESQEGGMHIRLRIPDPALYQQVNPLIAWLHAELQTAGHAVTLEVILDDHGTGRA